MNAQVDIGTANLMARNLIVGNAVKRTQSIKSLTVSPDSENVLNITPRNAGLILGFIVTVSIPVTVATGGTALTRTDFGAANAISKFAFYDLNNNTRINTSGRHLSLVNTARGGSPFGASVPVTDYPVAFGQNNADVISAPSAIAAGETAKVNMTYYVPLAYSDQDLRGAIYANVVNATANLQLTLNNKLVQARTISGVSDAVYVTADASTAPGNVTVGNASVNVYQVYYDQIPQGPNGAVLPVVDMSTIYELKETTLGNLTPNQDFPIPYSNFRDFLSTIVLYRNRAAVKMMNNGDINYLAMESANYTNLFKIEPKISNLWSRQVIKTDFPQGVFYIPTRTKPISTVQYGNMNLILNASDVQNNAVAIVGFEAFALTNVVSNAQSLAAN